MDEKLKEDLMLTEDLLDWITACKDEILYVLANLEDYDCLARIAEGLGQQSVSLINRLSTKE